MDDTTDDTAQSCHRDFEQYDIDPDGRTGDPEHGLGPDIFSEAQGDVDWDENGGDHTGSFSRDFADGFQDDTGVHLDGLQQESQVRS